MKTSTVECEVSAEVFHVNVIRWPTIKIIIKELIFRSSHREVFLGKGVLKICSKFTGEHSCRSVISIKLLYNFIEITLRHGFPPVNLLHIFRTPFLKNTSGWLLQDFRFNFLLVPSSTRWGFFMKKLFSVVLPNNCR